jgi:hypothetical protein
MEDQSGTGSTAVKRRTVRGKWTVSGGHVEEGPVRVKTKSVRGILARSILMKVDRSRRSGSTKCEQVLVHLIFQRCAQTVRGALVDLQGRALDELGLECS